MSAVRIWVRQSKEEQCVELSTRKENGKEAAAPFYRLPKKFGLRFCQAREHSHFALAEENKTTACFVPLPVGYMWSLSDYETVLCDVHSLRWRLPGPSLPPSTSLQPRWPVSPSPPGPSPSMLLWRQQRPPFASVALVLTDIFSLSSSSPVAASVE